jgi:hypothetical protein
MDTNRKERNQTVLFADNMILYLKGPKYSTRKLLELISPFTILVGHKINV